MGKYHLFCSSKSKSHCKSQSVGQFVLVSRPSWSSWPHVTFTWVKITFFVFNVGRPIWREDGSIIRSEMTQVQFQVTLRPTVCRPLRLVLGPPMGPITRFQFLCLTFISSSWCSHYKCWIYEANQYFAENCIYTMKKTAVIWHSTRTHGPSSYTKQSCTLFLKLWNHLLMNCDTGVWEISKWSELNSTFRAPVQTGSCKLNL
jgi:hypothetical protein